MHWQFISSCFCFEAPSPFSPNTHSVTYAPHKLLQMDNHVRYAINIFTGNKDASGRSDCWIQKNGTLGISTLIWIIKS